MKKSLITVIIFSLLGALPSWGDSIDSVNPGSVNDSVITVEVNGTFSDGCERDPVVLTTSLDDQVLLQIFTLLPEDLPADGNDSGGNDSSGSVCPAEEVPFSLSTDVSVPGEDAFMINVLLYQGTPRTDEDVVLNDSLAVQVEQDVEPPPDSVEVELEIRPNTINLKRRGRYIMGQIELPEGSPDVVNRDSILLQVSFDGVTSGDAFPLRSAVIDDSLVLQFDSDEVLGLIEETVEEFPAVVTFEVKGELTDGTLFSATDDVRVINPGIGPR